MNTPQITFTTGGTVQAGGGFYLARQADEDLLQLCREGRFAYILTARQMGKSSLMVRTADVLTAENIRAVMIDLTQIGTQVTPEQWYLGLLAMIEEQLQLATDAVAWWQANAHLGLTQRLTRFLQEVLLREINDPIVIFVDEIDTTLSLDFTDDFFAAIRSYYNARATAPEFARLSFVLIGVATPGDLIRDPQRTPFNIGQRVDLTDFTRAEAQPLADGLHLPPAEAAPVLDRVLHWTNGHPYLTQRLCQALVDERRPHWTDADVDRAVEYTFFGAMSEQDNNLQFVRDMLTKRADDVEGVLTTYRAVRGGNRPVPDEEQSLNKLHLKLSGIVRRQPSGALHVSNRIYEAVFEDAWVRGHLPVNWRRRFRYAAATLLVALLIFAPAISIYAWKNKQLEKTLTAGAQTLSIALAADSSLLGPIDPDLSLSLVNEAVRKAPTTQAEDRLRQFMLETRMQYVLRGHSQQVFSAGYSPDGKFIVTASNDRTACVWNALTAQLIAELKGHSDTVNSAAYSPDGKFIVTASTDQTARVWNASTAQPITELKGHSDAINSAAFSPDGRFIVTASRDKTARVWNAATAQLVVTLEGHSAGVNSATYSFDGRFIVTASADKTVRVWNAVTAQLIAELKGPERAALSAAYSPDDRFIVTASDGGIAQVWNASTAQFIAELKGHSAAVRKAAYSPNGKLIVTASDDGTVQVWDAVTFLPGIKLMGHSSRVVSSAFSPNGKSVVTASWDKTARIWNVSTTQSVVELKGHSSVVNSATYSPDGRFIVTASDDAKARVWNTTTSQMASELDGHSNPVLWAAYSPDSKFIVTANADTTTQVWNAATAQQVAKLIGHLGIVESAAYSPDGKFIVTASKDTRAFIWNAMTAQLVDKLTHFSHLKSVTYSPDSKFIVTASYDGTVSVWDASTAQLVTELKSPSGPVSSAAYSPDGKFIVTAYYDGTACVWNAATAQRVAELKGHLYSVNSATYSPDGKFIVTASNDQTARVWNAATAQLVAELKGHSGSVNSAAYSPDGNFIVTASKDGTARIYPRVMFMPFAELMELARRLSPRNLTPVERERYLRETPSPPAAHSGER